MAARHRKRPVAEHVHAAGWLVRWDSSLPGRHSGATLPSTHIPSPTQPAYWHTPPTTRPCSHCLRAPQGHSNCLEFLAKFNVPMLIVGGGGYTMRNVARCWCYETGRLLGLDLPDE